MWTCSGANRKVCRQLVGRVPRTSSVLYTTKPFTLSSTSAAYFEASKNWRRGTGLTEYASGGGIVSIKVRLRVLFRLMPPPATMQRKYRWTSSGLYILRTIFAYKRGVAIARAAFDVRHSDLRSLFSLIYSDISPALSSTSHTYAVEHKQLHVFR
jgi:hypothetical protein